MALATGTALLLGGAASALGGAAGAAMQSGAAKDAANLQASATQQANDQQRLALEEQRKIYDQQRADQEPWRQAGMRALSDLGNADFQRDFSAADFQQDPGYQFRMAEGQKALERSAAAKGGLQSGGTLKALARYGQDVASNEYSNAYNRFNADRDRRFNRLSSLAGVGQTANSAVANAGTNFGSMAGNYAGQVGQNLTGLANATGAAGIAGANAWGNALSGVGKSWMDIQSMNMMDKYLSKK